MSDPTVEQLVEWVAAAETAAEGGDLYARRCLELLDAVEAVRMGAEADVEGVRAEQVELRRLNAVLRLRHAEAVARLESEYGNQRYREAAIDECYRLIVYLWHRQLPGWTGEAWTDPGDPTYAAIDAGVDWRQVAHLIRALVAHDPDFNVAIELEGDPRAR